MTRRRRVDILWAKAGPAVRLWVSDRISEERGYENLGRAYSYVHRYITTQRLKEYLLVAQLDRLTDG